MSLTFSIAHVLGGLLLIFSASFLMPAFWSLTVSDGLATTFFATALGCCLSGIVLRVVSRGRHREIQPREGCLLVVLTWIVLACAAAVPFYSAIPGISLTDAYFESMSGLTTTGATVLTGLDTLPESLNLWRHQLQWLGGMGIIVLAVAVLPMLGVGGMQLFKAEMPGPMKDAKLTPRVTQSAKYLWIIYVVFTVLCVLALQRAGMSWHDAVCHAFSALSLGGFSTRDASIGHYNSPLIEGLLVIFMLLAVLNFATHFLAFRERSLRVYWRDVEVHAVWLVLLGSVVLLGTYLAMTSTYPDWHSAFRFALFNVISVGTTTGYMSGDYAAWPVFAPMWMLLLSCIASSAGSTGGGIKMIRVLILVKQAGHELARIVHPRAVSPLCINGRVMESRVILSVLGYMLLYGVTVATLTFVMMATGLDFVTAMSGIVASVNNLGPALNSLGPAHNFQTLSDLQTWVCLIAMLAGRLELLTVFVLFTPGFWRK